MAETRVYGHFEPKMFGQVAFIVNYLNPEIQKVFSRENLPAPAQAAIWSSLLKPQTNDCGLKQKNLPSQAQVTDRAVCLPEIYLPPEGLFDHDKDALKLCKDRQQ